MKKIETLRIKNFQTHKDTTLQFCKGLNVLVGESRNGKTAILRMLRWIYYNEPRGDRFIRSGEEQCEGEVILSDGTSVQRIRNRNGKINCYVLNSPGQEEQVFTKFGTEVPLEVQQALGVSKLYLDKDSSIELNFSRQMDAAFLVNDSGPRKSKIIGRVVNLHVIDSARRTAENDLKTSNRKKSDLEKEVCSLHEQISVYDDLPEKESALRQAHELLAQIDDFNSKAGKLQEINGAIQEIQSNLEKLNEKLVWLRHIGTASELIQLMCSKEKKLSIMEETQNKITVSLQCLNDHTQLLNELSNLENVENCFSDILAKAVRLTELQNVSQQILSTKSKLQGQEDMLANLQSLEESVERLSFLRSKQEVLTSFDDIHTSIKEDKAKLMFHKEFLERTQNIEQGQVIISALYQLREKGFKLSEIQTQIGDSQKQLQKHIEVSNRLADNSKTFSLFSRLQVNANRLRTLEDLETHCKALGRRHKETVANMSTLEEKYLHLVEDYKTTLEESGSCPVCHTIMTPDAVNRIASGM